MSDPIFALGQPPDDLAFAALSTRVLDALGDGSKTVAVDLDAITVLDSAAMRRLITLLRRTREHGGELRLITARADIRRSLAVTALDKIFHVAAPAPEVAA